MIVSSQFPVERFCVQMKTLTHFNELYLSKHIVNLREHHIAGSVSSHLPSKNMT